MEARTAASWLEIQTFNESYLIYALLGQRAKILARRSSWRSLQADLFGYGSYGLSSRRQATRIEREFLGLGELNEACR